MLNAYAQIAAAVAFPIPPGKVASVSTSAGEFAAVLLRHAPCGLLERDCPAVVAHALPGAEHLASPGTGKALEVRELLEELGGVLHGDPLDLRLLEHDLGDQDPVGIGGVPPGEVAAVGPEVREDEVAEEVDGLRGGPVRPGLFEDPLFEVVLVGVEAADHGISSVWRGQIGWAYGL